ncbi:Uncharacterised protein [Mycobacteroides abscessus subsp. abscessus]|nr:Uncharacterised protein [Mycobacteroides abscessus]SHS68596.1 Uncharacterised protein [Mycobacteroides abscessus subsp. abscessus]SKN19894.1 Uncharacterised protein [Mycobacteroides abscessus subsp. massiliense]SHU22617.1 Uncharacterised protein [Mycobacteroides abscessus subsp. abscessus]SHZ62580.1 Uncharacterised protein [Mycobacteroides abscessus subsp. abscessus]
MSGVVTVAIWCVTPVNSFMRLYMRSMIAIIEPISSVIFNMSDMLFLR